MADSKQAEKALRELLRLHGWNPHGLEILDEEGFLQDCQDFMGIVAGSLDRIVAESTGPKSDRELREDATRRGLRLADELASHDREAADAGHIVNAEEIGTLAETLRLAGDPAVSERGEVMFALGLSFGLRYWAWLHRDGIRSELALAKKKSGAGLHRRDQRRTVRDDHRDRANALWHNGTVERPSGTVAPVEARTKLVAESILEGCQQKRSHRSCHVELIVEHIRDLNPERS